MAQAGFTPLLTYSSSTGGNTPLAANLLNNSIGSELAINIADGKLFYKDTANAVQVIAWKTTPTTAGGTGLTTWTAGQLPYYSSGTTLSQLNIGTSGYFLTSSGTAPQWTDPTTIAVTSISFGTTGLTPSTATKGAITVAGTLVVGNGGTGLTSLTSGYIPYGNGSSAFSSSSGLTYNGTALTITYNDALFAGGFSIKNTATTGAAWARMDLQSGSNSSFAIYQATNGVVSLNQTGALDLAISTNNAERLRVFSSGGVSIGNTTDPGATNLSVTGTTTANTFKSDSGTTTAIASGTATTIFTMPGTTNGVYIVSIDVNSGVPAAFSYVSLVTTDGGVARTTPLQTATLAAISVSGLNIQATQASGGPQPIYWTVTRIS